MAAFVKKPGPFLCQKARVLDPYQGIDCTADVLISEEGVSLSPKDLPKNTHAIDAEGLWCMPGLMDMHVHLREPGFTHKETWESGLRAALAGGVTSLLVMPNTKPVLDTQEAVRMQQQGMQDLDGVELFVAAAATCELAGTKATDAQALKAAGAVMLTDDGKPVLDDVVMAEVLKRCKMHDLLMGQHAEDTRISLGAPIHAGKSAEKLGVAGQSAEAEYSLVSRDILLVREIKARYHVLHLSTKEALALVLEAKQEGLPVSCEVTPHHLLLNESFCCSGDTNGKMNPPLRNESDRIALVNALADGLIEAVASDHAPHTGEEKAQGLEKAPFGVVGLETSFSVLIELVHMGVLSPMRAVSLMTKGPLDVLKIPTKAYALSQDGFAKNCILVDPHAAFCVNRNTLFGKSTNSAFLGRTMTGRVVATFLRGVLRYQVDERVMV